MNKPVIITLDIETSPLLVYTWGLFDQNIGLDQIVEEWRILSFCYKELGKDKVHYTDVRMDPKDDSALLEKLWHVLDKADIIIGQNLKKFDMRKINARLIIEGYGPPSPYLMVDTLLEARSIAAFTSGKLAWLSQYLSKTEKDSHKEFPGFLLWKECLGGNKKAWAAMKKYNPQDVISTEDVYLKLRPWMKNHPNMGGFLDTEKPVCDKCGSEHLQSRGIRVLKGGLTYRQFQCMDCGGWSRGRTTEMSTKKRRAMTTS